MKKDRFNIKEISKSFVKDDRRSIMVEAAIYFPMIIILVLVLVMLSLFKLDKIMTQANLSIKANEMQLEMDQEEIFTFKYNQVMGNNSELDDKRILKVEGGSSRVYQWSDDRSFYPVVGVDYGARYAFDLFGLVPETTSHTFLVKHNPVNLKRSIYDISSFRENGKRLFGKIGINYNDYLATQYGY